MSVKCGNCKGTHETSNDVRGCYAQKSVADQARWANDHFSDEWHRKNDLPVPSRDQFQPQGGSFNNGGRAHLPEQPATDNQRKYIADLRAQKGLDPLAFAGTKRQASAEIDRLKALPDAARAARQSSGAPAVEDGRYAVVHDGVLKFYKVKNGYKRVFVEVYASDARHALVSSATRAEVLRLIAADPQAAMLKFGQEIGSCGHCGRTLTDQESRDYGVGPICRSKLGW